MGFFNDLFGFGKNDDLPQVPQFKLPEFAQGLGPQIRQLIEGQVGSQLGIPQELNLASEALQGLLGFQPDTTAFQLPIDAIQQALQAQQGIQLQDYLKQIDPILASQGQFDSSARTNLIDQFLRGQQAQSFGTSADLLTQQALQNLALQQQQNVFTPQFQAGIAGQLAGLGGQRSGIEQFNLQLPFQTTIPAFGNLFTQGQQQGQLELAPKMQQFSVDLQQAQQKQAQQQQLLQQLGGLGLSGIQGGLGGLASGIGFGKGALQGLAGISPSLSQFLKSPSTRFTPKSPSTRVTPKSPSTRFTPKFNLNQSSPDFDSLSFFQ